MAVCLTTVPFALVVVKVTLALATGEPLALTAAVRLTDWSRLAGLGVAVTVTLRPETSTTVAEVVAVEVGSALSVAVTLLERNIGVTKNGMALPGL
jgi:hypothetical protein